MPDTELTDNTTVQAKDYRVRRGELSAYGRAQNSVRSLQGLMVAVAVLVALLLLACIALSWGSVSSLVTVLLCVAVLLVLAGLWMIHAYTRENFVEPDLAFRKWLQNVCDGELDTQIELPAEHKHFKELDFHTRNLAKALADLSNDMEELVSKQTNRLRLQKQVLDLLFRLTADVSNETTEDAVLETVCNYLSEWFGSATVCAYQVNQGGDGTTQVARRFSGHDPLQSHVQEHGDNRLPHRPNPQASEIPADILFEDKPGFSTPLRIIVPYFTVGHPAGYLTIDLASADAASGEDTQRVLKTVSEQLSLFTEKSLATEQTQQARIHHDRNLLAADIHDSLAQTLLAARYQVALLLEDVKLSGDSGEPLAWREQLEKIDRAVRDANREARNLIWQYRSPLSNHQYAQSLETLLTEFGEEASMETFFQTDDASIAFTPGEESVIHRIVGEALTNAQKYSDANMIRVYLDREQSGARRVLVEDDGVGFAVGEPESSDNGSQQSRNGSPHVGLSIMHERAISIGARLAVDSEPGEGTRVSLVLPPLINPEGNRV